MHTIGVKGMFYNLIQKLATETSKTRDESAELLENAYNDLSTLVFPGESVKVSSLWESKTYKKIKEISSPFWREGISGLKSFYYEDATLTLRTGQPSLITIAKSDVYNFDFTLWKKTKLFGLDSQTFFVNVGNLISLTESGDNYVFECYARLLEGEENNSQFSGLMTPYKTLTGAEQVLYDMAKYNSTATDADRQALGIKMEKLKEYSYTKEKGDSEAYTLPYPDPIIKKIAALRKNRIPYIV